jgi:hypothetical protein
MGRQDALHVSLTEGLGTEHPIPACGMSKSVRPAVVAKTTLEWARASGVELDKEWKCELSADHPLDVVGICHQLPNNVEKRSIL